MCKPTILRLLSELGAVCADFHDRTVRGLRCNCVQCDEIWSFVRCKQKNVTHETLGKWGDIWTWTALDADTKLIVSWLVGNCERIDARAFMGDVADRIANRVQLSTDGFTHYLTAVDFAFGGDVDYATLTKVFSSSVVRRYSPARLIGIQLAVARRPRPEAHFHIIR